jgi:hypothetical protein
VRPSTRALAHRLARSGTGNAEVTRGYAQARPPKRIGDAINILEEGKRLIFGYAK